jgi:hypothetical protein
MRHILSGAMSIRGTRFGLGPVVTPLRLSVIWRRSQRSTAGKVRARLAVTAIGFAPVRIISLPYEIVLNRPWPLPLCDVYLLGPAGRVLVRSIVDSGAEYSVFPISAAEDVGLQITTAMRLPVQFGGSQGAGRRMKAHIELKGHRWSTEIIFTDKLDIQYGLLGRRGVFGQFNEVAFLEKVASPKVELRW